MGKWLLEREEGAFWASKRILGVVLVMVCLYGVLAVCACTSSKEPVFIVVRCVCGYGGQLLSTLLSELSWSMVQESFR